MKRLKLIIVSYYDTITLIIHFTNEVFLWRLKMKENIIKWIWQHKDYPNFKYNKLELTELLSKIEYNRGILDGISKLFSSDDIVKIESRLQIPPS